MHEWRPEVVVDAGWARRLIGTQFPEVELGSLRLLGRAGTTRCGWSTSGGCSGFPRREVVIPGFERELAVLPRLAERLPLPVPAPVFHGRPADGFPWPFSGAALLPGREVAVADLTDAERIREALPLARFLRALHTPGARGRRRDGSLLPVDVNGRAAMPTRVGLTVDRLAEAEWLGVWRAPEAVTGMLAAARALDPPPEPATLAHGDLHIRHLLVGADGRLSGVIDWIDVCRGDPGHRPRRLLPRAARSPPARSSRAGLGFACATWPYGRDRRR